MRDRLIELLDRKIEYSIAADEREDDFLSVETDALADYLLANGVIVPPCKVGDVVYYITRRPNKLVNEAKVEELYYNGDEFAYRVSSEYVYFDLQRDEAFLTREEAEAKLKEGVQG